MNRTFAVLLLCLAASLVATKANAQAFTTSFIAPSSSAQSAPLPTVIDEQGQCQVDVSSVDSSIAEGRGRYTCVNALMPRQPSPVLATPGAFFVGYAWGSKSRQFVYGPQVGVSGAVEIPIRRPWLERMPDAGGKMVFRRPHSMSFTFDLALSLNVNFASFTFPNQATSADTPSKTHQTFNAGAYVAPEVGWAWWTDDGRSHRIALALGVMGGLIDTDATGTAFALGFQPALVAQF